MSANAKETMRNELLWGKIKSRFFFRSPAIKTVPFRNIYVYTYMCVYRYSISIYIYSIMSPSRFFYFITSFARLTKLPQFRDSLLLWSRSIYIYISLYSRENLEKFMKSYGLSRIYWNLLECFLSWYQKFINY